MFSSRKQDNHRRKRVNEEEVVNGIIVALTELSVDARKRVTANFDADGNYIAPVDDESDLLSSTVTAKPKFSRRDVEPTPVVAPPIWGVGWVFGGLGLSLGLGLGVGVGQHPSTTGSGPKAGAASSKLVDLDELCDAVPAFGPEPVAAEGRVTSQSVKLAVSDVIKKVYPNPGHRSVDKTARKAEIRVMVEGGLYEAMFAVKASCEADQVAHFKAVIDLAEYFEMQRPLGIAVSMLCGRELVALQKRLQEYATSYSDLVRKTRTCGGDVWCSGRQHIAAEY